MSVFHYIDLTSRKLMELKPRKNGTTTVDQKKSSPTELFHLHFDRKFDNFFIKLGLGRKIFERGTASFGRNGLSAQRAH